MCGIAGAIDTRGEGRIPGPEILDRMTDALAARINEGATAADLAAAAGSPGLPAIAAQAVIDGFTSPAEALRVMGTAEPEPADG